MCGRAYDPDFLFMAQCKLRSWVGQAAGVLAEVRRGQIETAGTSGQKMRKRRSSPSIIYQFDAQASAYYASAIVGRWNYRARRYPACAGARISATMNV